MCWLWNDKISTERIKRFYVVKFVFLRRILRGIKERTAWNKEKSKLTCTKPYSGKKKKRKHNVNNEKRYWLMRVCVCITLYFDQWSARYTYISDIRIARVIEETRVGRNCHVCVGKPCSNGVQTAREWRWSRTPDRIRGRSARGFRRIRTRRWHADRVNCTIDGKASRSRVGKITLPILIITN